MSEIAKAFGYPRQHDLLLVVGTVSAGMPCEDCGQTLQATSRSRLKEIQNAAAGKRRRGGKNLSCDDCVAASDAARKAEHAAHRAQAAALWDAEVHATVLDWVAATMLVLSYPPILSHDPSAWSPHRLAQRIQAETVGRPATGTLGVRYHEAREIARAVTDVSTWDEITATRTIQAVGVAGTASAVAAAHAAALQGT